MLTWLLLLTVALVLRTIFWAAVAVGGRDGQGRCLSSYVPCLLCDPVSCYNLFRKLVWTWRPLLR